MEKIKKTFMKDYGILRLFKDDLEEIISFIDESNISELEIGNYSYKTFPSINEITENPLKHFQYRGYSPITKKYFTLTLNYRTADIYLSDHDDTELLGIFQKIDRILSKRENSIIKFLDSTYGLIIINIPIYLFLIYLIVYTEKPTALTAGLDILVILVWFGFMIGVITWIYRLNTKNHVIIYSYKSDSKISFFKEHQDFLKLLIATIIGTIIGSILTSYLI